MLLLTVQLPILPTVAESKAIKAINCHSRSCTVRIAGSSVGVYGMGHAVYLHYGEFGSCEATDERYVTLLRIPYRKGRTTSLK